MTEPWTNLQSDEVTGGLAALWLWRRVVQIHKTSQATSTSGSTRSLQSSLSRAGIVLASCLRALQHGEHWYKT